MTPTRQRILDVAADLFVEQGYEATSLRAISERLGFTKAALYYHFRSKEEILQALIEPVLGLHSEFLARLEAADTMEEWADALDWIIGAVLENTRLFALLVR